ncbi:MAG TPA: Crp/Fnr family transcriptional regulator [Bacteroidetes bacterium]|nr:Crp/Fnr family transcriptional regulator [Bacteroidota bacterium]
MGEKQENYQSWYLENINMHPFLCPEKWNACTEKLYEKGKNQFNKGQSIYATDQEATHVYVVVCGRVKIGMYSEGGKEIIKAILQSGEIFGEMAILGETVRSDFAVALDDEVKLCVMSLAKVKQLMLENQDFSQQLTSTIGRKLEKMERRLEALVFKDARTRIIEFVRELADRKGKPQGTHIHVADFFTHKDIASLTATSRQTVTSVLNNLRDLGLIQFDRRSLRIPDPGLLS